MFIVKTIVMIISVEIAIIFGAVAFGLIKLILEEIKFDRIIKSHKEIK